MIATKYTYPEPQETDVYFKPKVRSNIPKIPIYIPNPFDVRIKKLEQRVNSLTDELQKLRKER